MEVLGVCLMKIRRRRSKKGYLGKKRLYEYERFSVDIPAKFGDAVRALMSFLLLFGQVGPEFLI